MIDYTLTFENYILEPIPLHSHAKITDTVAKGIASHWGKPLTESQFLKREKFLEKNDICKPGNFHGKNSKKQTLIKGKYRFVLRDLSISDSRTDYEDEKDINTAVDNIVSSCELIVRDAFRTNEEGDIESCLNGCLGSVFTLKHHRKKGYAKVMLNCVNSWCAEFINDKYLFNTLYSEVDEYYNQFGYVSRYIPVFRIPNETIFDFAKGKIPQSVGRNINYNVKLMKIYEFKDLINVTNEKIIDDLKKSSKSDHKIRYFNKFNYQLVDWLHERSIFYVKELTDYHNIVNFGLSLNDPVTGSPLGHIIWQFNFGDKHIDILSIESLVENDQDKKQFIIECLMSEMLSYFKSDLQSFISEYFYKGIYMWQNYITENISIENSSFKKFLHNELNAEIVVKQFDDSLSAIKLFNDKDNSNFKPNEEKDDCDVLWECNFKWAWF